MSKSTTQPTFWNFISVIAILFLAIFFLLFYVRKQQSNFHYLSLHYARYLTFCFSFVFTEAKTFAFANKNYWNKAMSARFYVTKTNKIEWRKSSLKTIKLCASKIRNLQLQQRVCFIYILTLISKSLSFLFAKTFEIHLIRKGTTTLKSVSLTICLLSLHFIRF